MDNNMLLNGINKILGEIGFSDLSQFEILLILLTIAFFVILIIWLASRQVALWYWKVNVQVNTLNRIDDSLKNMGASLKNMEENISKQEQLCINDKIEKTEKNGEINPEMGKAEIKNISKPHGEIFVAKTGKVYTEEELELQIRD